MNAMNGWLLKAVEAEPHAGGGPAYGRGPVAPPTLLITMGAQAAAVASAALESGQPWWGMPSSCRRLDLPLYTGTLDARDSAVAGLRQQLTMLCADLAADDGPLAHAPQDRAASGRPVALSLWLLLDLTEGDNETGSTAGAQALQVLQLLDVVAWQRLQVAVRPQVLLLARAGDQQSLDACRQRLEVMAPDPYWVIGLPEAGADDRVHQAAATTAAVLLWGAPPLTRLDAPFLPKPARYYAVGAGVHAFPTAALSQTLALWELCAALRDGEVLLAEAAPQAANPAELGQASALCHWAQQLLAQGAALAAEIPGPAAVAWGRGRPPWWRRAMAPARMLLAQRQVELAPLRNAQRQARQQWLSTQLSAWAAAWQQFNLRWLTSRRLTTKAQADVGAYAAALQQLWRCVLAQTQQIDDTLATLAEATTRTQATVQMCSAAVDACCASVPTLSVAGLWQWCTQPRQWGRWLWTMLVTLPRRVHALARAVAACEAAVYQETNAHLVRQVGLAILQDVQLQQSWLPKVRGYLRAASQVSEEQLAAQLAALPTPWTPLLVATLAQRLADGAGGTQGGRAALDVWLQQSAAEAWAARSPEAVVTEVAAAFAESSEVIEQWRAADWLTAMFPKPVEQPGRRAQGQPPRGVMASGQRATPPTLGDWLDGLAAAAEPLWPVSAPSFGWGRRDTSSAEGWLLLPAPLTDVHEGGEAGQGGAHDVESWLTDQEREAGIVAWLKAHAGWQRGATPLPALLLLRRRPIA